MKRSLFKLISPEIKLKDKYVFLAVLIIIIGVAVRVISLSQNPAGFNQDEASAGYEAFSLLRYGIDRNSQSYPAMFISWGSGQNVLYSYLLIPLISIFGLSVFSVRLLSAAVGAITLLIFYLLCKRLRGEIFGLFALFLLTINPWHIMISRWALESNLLPFMLLLGIYFFIVRFDRKYVIIFSALFFGLALYAYTTAFIFIPVFAALCIPGLVKKRPDIFYIPAAAVFIIVALPALYCLFINAFGLPSGKLFGLVLPALTEGRQIKTTIFGAENMREAAIYNFGKFLSLLAMQTDGHAFNSVKPYGLYYFWGLPVSVFGIGLSIKSIRKKSVSQNETIILTALAACVICAFLINVNINRMNMIFLPLLYFNAVGVYWIYSRLRRVGSAFILAHIIVFCMFVCTYFTTYRAEMSAEFFEGFGDALHMAESESAGRDIVITNYINMPYIYVLFYNQIPVREFTDTVKYYNPDDDFRWVSSFSKYRFGIEPYYTGRDCVYIIAGNELIYFKDGFKITEHKNFYTAVPE